MVCSRFCVSTANHLLLLTALVILGLRVLHLLGFARWLDGGQDGDEPTYPEPKLTLDKEVEQAHDVFGELASTLVVDQAADQRYLKGGKRDLQMSSWMPVSAKIVLTGALAWMQVGVPYLHPSMARFRLLSEKPKAAASNEAIAAGGPMPSASVGEAKLPGATYDQQGRAKELDSPKRDSRGPLAHGGKSDTPTVAPAVDEKKPPRSIEDPSGKALSKFFAKLTRVETKQPGAIARVLYYGDSIIASDFVSGKLRRKLQDRFGDAGHGYAIVANAWPGWFHIDVARTASPNWLVSTCVGPYAKDGLYGLGCASFQSYHKSTWTEFATASRDKWGRKVSRFELEYLEQPGGGSIELLIDGEVRETIETASDETKVAYHTVKAEDGAHRFRIQTVDKRPVRVFGIRMERDVPGVTLSALGITGARARFLDKQNDAHWAAALRASKPDLICLAFGSNEVTDGGMYPMDKYRATLGAVMKQVEEALPNASYMLVGPPDMASKSTTQGHTRTMVPIIVKNQRELAKERGWAFWDQFRAMGGGGSMWAWVKAGLGSKDMFHPTGRGGSMLGNWEYLALVEAFEKYKAAQR